MRQPLSFIRASRFIAKKQPTGRGWAHELKHDGYRLQIQVRDGRVRLWRRLVEAPPRIIEESARIKGNAVDEIGLSIIRNLKI